MVERADRAYPTRVLVLLVALVAMLLMPAGSVAQEAPDYEAATLDGAPFDLASTRGSVVLLNLWATWCEPCREEMPELGSLAAEYQGAGLMVVGVNIDRTRSHDQIAAFAAKHGAEFPIVLDPDNTFARAFRTSGVPETVLIDRSGAIAHQWKGALEDDDPETRRLIQAALDSPGLLDDTAVPGVVSVGLAAAFLAGLVSILSPCVFPLIPTYAAFITGASVEELTARQRGGARWRTLRRGILFVAGFSAVFIALGASASALGEVLHDSRVWIARGGGIVMLIMGLHLLGVFRIPVIDRVARLDIGTRHGIGPLGTVAIGVAFGASWTPCIGPVLASILTLAAASASVWQGVTLLAVYSLGLAVPFLLATVLLDRFMVRRARFGVWLPRIERLSGALIVLIGILMVTGTLERLATRAAQFGTLG